MNYKVFSNVMNKFFNNKTFHNPTNELIYNSKKKKRKMFYPCKIEEHIYIDNKEFVFHHYNNKAKEIILYFPGGSFVDPPTMLHYKFAKRIAKKLNKHIIMVQYPLTPESNPHITAKLLKRICLDKFNEKISIMGDSAGANLAGLLLHSFHIDELDFIDKVVLISPFINKNLDNEKILLIEGYDFVLSYQNCKALMDVIFKPLLDDGFNIFPNNNSFSFETNILMISGEKEIFTPDIINWVNNEKTLNISYLLYKDMCHCFPIIPCKQSSHCIEKIKTFFNKTIDYR